MLKPFLILALVVQTVQVSAALSLPAIFSDNMVLQRDKALNIWGTAGAGERVTVRFNGQVISVMADAHNGKWQTRLRPMSYGGPYDLKVSAAADTVVLKNILIGDVWMCSGQSNMEFQLARARNAKEEIAAADYPDIRLFTVPLKGAYAPATDIAGAAWQPCNPQTMPNFSAVAYFFARKLHRDLHIPVGLVSSSWGGTNIQAWISWDSMRNDPGYQGVDIRQYGEKAATAEKAFSQAMQTPDNGTVEQWFARPAGSFTTWTAITQPQFWESSAIGNEDGIIWFEKEFDLPDTGMAVLSLGPIDDFDSTFVNGVVVGHSNDVAFNRVYEIPSGLLKKGPNTLVVKVTDRGGLGGFYGKPDQLFLIHHGKKIPLSGEWRYKPAVLATDFGFRGTGPNGFPSELYNAMIAPWTALPIKGVIWYQGEANTYQGLGYERLLKRLILDWRGKWGDAFPFLWVQLPNYMAPDSLPSQSDWAELREAQRRTLSLPHTAQAVTIDIGEAGNIHPQNKQDVGYRLALAAEKIAYGKDLVYSGPVYQSMERRGHRIVLHFSHVGGGLVAGDGGALKGFAIAGKDHHFQWATAYIEGDKVVVYNDTVPDPIAVRYAWADNPAGANLYDTAHLPAGPFQTDN